MESCTANEYENHVNNLKKIYYGLKVSISDATIVAHSKALAHILPALIPPIDRQYTIRFFTQDNKQFFSDAGKYRMITVLKGIAAQFDDFKKYTCRIKALFDRCDCKCLSSRKSHLTLLIRRSWIISSCRLSKMCLNQRNRMHNKAFQPTGNSLFAFLQRVVAPAAEIPRSASPSNVT